MDKPKCACFQVIPEDSNLSYGELKSLEAGTTMGLLFGDTMAEFGACPEAAYHIFLTSVVVMLHGLCAGEIMDMDTNAHFFKHLDTLAADLRQRHEEMEPQRNHVGTTH